MTQHDTKAEWSSPAKRAATLMGIFGSVEPTDNLDLDLTGLLIDFMDHFPREGLDEKLKVVLTDSRAFFQVHADGDPDGQISGQIGQLQRDYEEWVRKYNVIHEENLIQEAASGRVETISMG